LSNNQSGSRQTLVFGCDTKCVFARIYEIRDDAFEPRCLVYDRNVDENSIDGEVQPARLIAVAKSVIDKSLAAANYSVEAIESVAIGGSKASSPEIQDMLHAKFKRGILKTIDPSKVISVGALVTAAELADRI
ncbi:MAG: Hsp70 family protein, partial [Cyanobacteria bacterium SZAS LIN-5]|nr:Hsp70 family protein [Cyanobacteria bacterium SZAS LIN-5]